MQSVSQMIKKQAHQQVRNRIREIVQPGTLQAIFLTCNYAFYMHYCNYQGGLLSCQNI